MNSLYKSFMRKYGGHLLEGQANILKDLETRFFPALRTRPESFFPTLVRMPTGTGKTGVSAIVSYLANDSGTTLVLTPWRALCTQMGEDFDTEFWKHLNVTPEDMAQFHVPSKRMLPSTLRRTLVGVAGTRSVLIGTLSGLQFLHSRQPALYQDLRSLISLVIVDEGHYEPAVRWGRAVRDLERPSLVVTATPYRNDLKLFRVNARDVFHYQHHDAVKAPKFPLRHVVPRSLAHSSDDFEALVNEFLDVWKKEIRPKSPCPEPRAIICCDTKKRVMDALRIVRLRGIDCLGFHERVEPEDFAGNHDLKRRFLQKVPAAKGTHEEIWIHQNKLTEGVDDPRFCAILITYPFTNDRRLVQQVGRILRHWQRKGNGAHRSQRAVGVHCADYPFEETWKNYLEFERDPELVTGEYYRTMVLRYLDLQPPYEYLDGRFRRRLEPFSMITAKDSDSLTGRTKARSDGNRTTGSGSTDQWKSEAKTAILTPPSVTVLNVHKGFKMGRYIEDTRDSLILNDAVILDSEGRDQAVVQEGQTVMWLYALIKNSDVLLRRSAYEITIEARFAHLEGEYLFVGDTGGIREEHGAESTSPCGYVKLAGILKDTDIVRQASLFNTQSQNQAVRRVFRQGTDLGFAPYQVSERKYICHNLRVRRIKTPGDRYVGLTSSRVSQRLTQEMRRGFNLTEFTRWAHSMAGELKISKGEPAPFLSRYAQVASTPLEAVPHALILDPFADPAATAQEGGAATDVLDLTWREVGSGKALDIESTVFTFDNSDDVAWPFRLVLTSNSREANPPRTEVVARYEAARGLFRFKRTERTDFQVEYQNDVFSVAHFLSSRRDRHTIILKEPLLVCHNRDFFAIDYQRAEEKFAALFTAVPGLRNTSFEKVPYGISPADRRRLRAWPADGVFRVTLRQVLRHGFANPDWVYCDDAGQSEIADFIVASFSTKRIVFIHCKHGGTQLSASAFHELCSQATKNLVYLRTPRTPPNVQRWTRTSTWGTSGIRRWSVGGRGLPERTAMWQKIRSEILDASDGRIEVWLVMGDGLDIARLKGLAANANGNAEVGPLIHLLDGVAANCAEATVGLRIFAH